MTTTVLDPAPGRASLDYVDASQPARPLVIQTYRPAGHRPDDPVVVVQHGVKRNGDDYRDFWIDAAEKFRLLIVAPTFPADRYPEPENYNNGRVRDEAGGFRPRQDWLYGIPARVVKALRASGAVRGAPVRLFGHSAGGQFVHRLSALEAELPYEAAIAGNSGWYTLPTLEKPFPEGLGGLGLGPAELARWFARPLTILAGELDIDVNDPHLPRNPEALAQGSTRFARAANFMAVAKREAARLGVPLAWKYVPVPGVAHNGAAMSRVAAEIWFGVGATSAFV